MYRLMMLDCTVTLRDTLWSAMQAKEPRPDNLWQPSRRRHNGFMAFGVSFVFLRGRNVDDKQSPSAILHCSLWPDIIWNDGLMMMIAFITFNSSLVSLIEGLCSSILCEFEFSGFRRNRTDDLGINSLSLWPTEPRLHVRSYRWWLLFLLWKVV